MTPFALIVNAFSTPVLPGRSKQWNEWYLGLDVDDRKKVDAKIEAETMNTAGGVRSLFSRFKSNPGSSNGSLNPGWVKWLDDQVNKVSEEVLEGAKEKVKEAAMAEDRVEALEVLEGAEETVKEAAMAEVQARVKEVQDRVEALSEMIAKEVTPSIAEQGEGLNQKATMVRTSLLVVNFI